MARSQQNMIGVEIDKITNSIENVITGEVFATSMVQIKAPDMVQIKKTKWLFDWSIEILDEQKLVYKLVVDLEPKTIQGLMSLEDKGSHIFMHLIESAKSNRGKNKAFLGVPANMIAFACKTAFENGYEGVVSFLSKTRLVEHYKKTIDATQFSGDNMYVDTNAAKVLVSKYFKDFKL